MLNLFNITYCRDKTHQLYFVHSQFLSYLNVSDLVCCRMFRSVEVEGALSFWKGRRKILKSLVLWVLKQALEVCGEVRWMDRGLQAPLVWLLRQVASSLCLLHMHAGPIHHPGGWNVVRKRSVSRLDSQAMKLLVTQKSDLTSLLKLDFLTCGATVHYGNITGRPTVSNYNEMPY
jgi:hypothetical protein